MRIFGHATEYALYYSRKELQEGGRSREKRIMEKNWGRKKLGQTV